MKNLLWVFGLSGLLVAVNAPADEDQTSEYAYQLNLSANGNLPRRFHWSLDTPTQFDHSQHFVQTASQLGLSWSVTNRVVLGGAGRWTRIKDEQGKGWNRQRALGYVSVGILSVPHWNLSYRTLWQGDWRNTAEAGTPHVALLRNRVQLRYRGFESIGPYVAVEPFHRLDRDRHTSGMDRMRYTLGTDIAVGKHFGLALSAYRQVYTYDHPDSYQFGLEYSYGFSSGTSD